MAQNNIKKYKSKKVKIRCGNGLEVIDENDNIDTVIISGMGYQTIIRMLKNTDKLTKINKLIIQSNTNPEIVKKYLIKNEFYIEKEKIVLDKNIYYIITCYKKGKRKYSDLDTEIGIFESNEDSKKYIEVEIKKNKILLSIIPFSNIFRRMKIRKRLKLLIKKKNSMK
jgi:tRNA (adenine22-N1)-methyltransferase